jgi:hypothetical protein
MRMWRVISCAAFPCGGFISYFTVICISVKTARNKNIVLDYTVIIRYNIDILKNTLYQGGKPL